VDKGLKESTNKLLTLEVDAKFIQEMIQVMTDNKSKYPRFNHYKPLNPIDLLEALERHYLELKSHIQSQIANQESLTDLVDPTDGNSHLVKIATNAMMTWIQLQNANRTTK